MIYNSWVTLGVDVHRMIIRGRPLYVEKMESVIHTALLATGMILFMPPVEVHILKIQ
jgi:hypothetical protein